MKKGICIILLFLIFGFNTGCFAATNLEKLDVNISPVPLNSKLKKNYVGYDYTITNNSQKNLNLLTAQVINGNDGNIAYNSTEQGAGSAVGLTWAICGPLGLFTFGIAWLAGIVATPIVWVVANNSDKKARRESIAYTNMVPVGYLNSGESIQIKTLVPLGSKPQLKLNIIDDTTKEIYSITK